MQLSSADRCLDPSSIDPAKGIPLEGLPPEIREADVDGDAFIRGSLEIELLSEARRRYELSGRREGAEWMETMGYLDFLLPRIEEVPQAPEPPGPLPFDLLYGGERVRILYVAPHSPDPTLFSLVAGAVGLFPPLLWGDLVRTLNPTLFVGTFEDLKIHFESHPGSEPALPKNYFDPRRVTASSFHYYHPDDPRWTRSSLLLPTDLADQNHRLTRLERAGCLQSTMIVNGFFWVTAHETGHLFDSAMPRRFKKGGSLTSFKQSLVSLLFEEQKERDLQCNPRHKPAEEFADSLALLRLCPFQAAEGGPSFGECSPDRDSSTLEPLLWNNLRKAVEQFLQGSEIDPAPFLECRDSS